jgi:hypothetical protein
VGHRQHQILGATLSTSTIYTYGQTLRNKVIAVVGTVAHRAPSLLKCTRDLFLWFYCQVENRLTKMRTTSPRWTNTATIVNFDARFREIIQVHSNQDDRYEVVQSLRAYRKPQELPVQSFWYKLREFDWIPGIEPALND